MNTLRARTLFAAALLTTLAPGAAFAGSTEYTASGAPVRWHRGSISFAVDPEGATGEFADLRAIVERAASRWAAVPGVTRLDVTNGAVGPLGSARTPSRAQSGVAVYRTPPPVNIGRSLAVTMVTVNRASGEIVDAVVVVNAAQHAFAQLGAEGLFGDVAAPYDIENTISHELGHVLGLRDDATESAATMFVTAQPGEVSKRDLDPADEESARLAYADSIPERPGDAPMPSIDDAPDGAATQPTMPAGCGGARISPRSPVSPALPLAITAIALLVLAASRARWRRIECVMAAGALLVVASPSPERAPPAGAERVTAVATSRRVAGFVTTRAQVTDAAGNTRWIELPGGRVGAYDVRVHDAPSGSDLEPGAAIEWDGDRVVRVYRP